MEVRLWTIVLIFIITTLVVAFCIISAWKYYEIYQNPEPNSKLSKNFALGLFISSIVVGFLTFLIWIWCFGKFIQNQVNSRAERSFGDTLMENGYKPKLTTIDADYTRPPPATPYDMMY